MEPERDEAGEVAGAAEGSRERPWLGVRFTCANAYVRVFRNPDGAQYVARCPKCGQSVTFRVGQGGTDQRFFEVSC